MLTAKLNSALSTGAVNRVKLSFLSAKLGATKQNGRRFTNSNQMCAGHFNAGFNESVNERARRVAAHNLIIASSAQKVSLRLVSSNTLPTPDFQEKADIFGDLANNKYDKIGLDEAELKEEEFVMNEAKPHRSSVPSPGKYADMIKKHIQSGHLDAAVAVLDQVKQDRQKPNAYMYNLLIRAFAVRGNVKKCYTLYNQMKKQGLKPSSPTYVSLMNACANYHNSQIALEKVSQMRQLFIEKAVPLTAVHYNVMIKVYGRHGKLAEAFELADEMYDKKLTIGISTLNFLLQGAITDKQSGFRHSIVIWQLMRSRKLKPNIYTYNLLLRSARDCKLGDIKIEDILVSPNPNKIIPAVTYSDRTNLLVYPPIIGVEIPLIEDSKPLKEIAANDNSLEAKPESPESITIHKNDTQPAIADTNTILPLANISSASPDTNLLLLGGFHNLITQMKIDNVEPDIKTVTCLLELVPSTISAEKAVIKYAKSMGIKLDIDFYNILIRKRSFKFDYKNALDVLKLIQKDNLVPNIMTWGVLALTCRSAAQAKELFEGMELSGHRLNIEIIGAILRQATRRWLFGLVLELMEKIRTGNLSPSHKIYETLDTFKKDAAQMAKDKNAKDFVREPFWTNGYRKFNLRYASWIQEMKDLEDSRKKRS